VRVPEEVTSVVLGDPVTLRMNNLKPSHGWCFSKLPAKPAQTNALITTRGGQEISVLALRIIQPDKR
jgi:hypothetical protein